MCHFLRFSFFLRNIKSLSPNFSFSLPAGLPQKPMRLQVSSNKLSHSKFKFIITKPIQRQISKPRERERDETTPISSFEKPFSQRVFFGSSFFFVVFDDFVYMLLQIICMEIWCSFVSKLTEADMESVLAGRGLLFFYGSGHWILQWELIYYLPLKIIEHNLTFVELQNPQITKMLFSFFTDSSMITVGMLLCSSFYDFYC
ncbi:hypothetical protein Hanom_Chr02g00156291 [Helianthus anomalus]